MANPIGASPAAAVARRARADADGETAGWRTEVAAFLKFKAEETPVGSDWIRRIRWELTRLPNLIKRLGSLPAPTSASGLAPEHVGALRDGMRWEKATFAIHFAALRQFARWAGNPIAQRSSVWRLPSGQPSRRRWLSKSQLTRLLNAAQGREKVLVALEGLNGLRRVEVLRLRRRDVLPSEGCLRVLGKGRNGGKWRQIPIHPVVGPILDDAVTGIGPEQRLLGLSSSGADALLARAADRAGLSKEGVKVSHHDLRRTFGRIAHEAGMDLVQLKNLLGHSSVEMTVHYIGLDSKRMREGLERVRLEP